MNIYQTHTLWLPIALDAGTDMRFPSQFPWGVLTLDLKTSHMWKLYHTSWKKSVPVCTIRQCSTQENCHKLYVKFWIWQLSLPYDLWLPLPAQLRVFLNPLEIINEQRSVDRRAWANVFPFVFEWDSNGTFRGFYAKNFYFPSFRLEKGKKCLIGLTSVLVFQGDGLERNDIGTYLSNSKREWKEGTQIDLGKNILLLNVQVSVPTGFYFIMLYRCKYA